MLLQDVQLYVVLLGLIQVDGWALSYKGYVFTYTAKEANYDSHSDEISKIIDKVKFK